MPTEPGRVRSFAPIADANARLLILGSMPGEASLQAQQYYAHPHNLFWPILGEAVGALPSLPYEERTQRLRDSGIAVWDVLAHCRRPGSLDAAIDLRSAQANDFAAFFDGHPQLRRVLFNGATAEAIFRRQVAPALPTRAVEWRRLPSTSPANASIPRAEKFAAWLEALR